MTFDNLAEPIILHIPKIKNLSDKSTWTASYWDQMEKKWKSDGVTLLNETNTHLVISTTHLSIFGTVENYYIPWIKLPVTN